MEMCEGCRYATEEECTRDAYLEGEVISGDTFEGAGGEVESTYNVNCEVVGSRVIYCYEYESTI